MVMANTVNEVDLTGNDQCTLSKTFLVFPRASQSRARFRLVTLLLMPPSQFELPLNTSSLYKNPPSPPTFSTPSNNHVLAPRVAHSGSHTHRNHTNPVPASSTAAPEASYRRQTTAVTMSAEPSSPPPKKVNLAKYVAHSLLSRPQANIPSVTRLEARREMYVYSASLLAHCEDTALTITRWTRWPLPFSRRRRSQIR